VTVPNPFDSSNGLPAVPAPKPNGIAVASFVLGLISVPLFPLGWILGPVAILLGVTGRRNAKGGAPYGAQATWGLVLGGTGSILGIGFFIAGSMLGSKGGI